MCTSFPQVAGLEDLGTEEKNIKWKQEKESMHLYSVPVRSLGNGMLVI